MSPKHNLQSPNLSKITEQLAVALSPSVKMEDNDSVGSSFLRKSPLESQPNAEINFALP